jgi:hypothetical protein
VKCRLLRRVLAVRWWACAAQISHSRHRAEGAVAKHAATRLSNGAVAVDTYDNMFEVELFAYFLFRSFASSRWLSHDTQIFVIFVLCFIWVWMLSFAVDAVLVFLYSRNNSKAFEKSLPKQHRNIVLKSRRFIYRYAENTI